jgi:hypothetical protein
VKPPVLSDFNPRERISKSCSNYRKVEARIMRDEVGLRMKIEEGVEILGTDKSMGFSVRDRDQSDPRD